MRSLALLFAVALALPVHAARQTARLVAPSPGATLPVTLTRTLNPEHLAPGQPVIARFFQRVPVSPGVYLPSKTEIIGQVVSSDPSSLSIRFDQLRWKGETVPVHVKLLAAASYMNVSATQMPVGGAPDRGTSSPADWTTRQVGGDEVYRSAGAGGVYDRYSQPVGHADLTGVYAPPLPGDGQPRSMGPFSTTATGLHGLTGFTLLSAGGPDTPITLKVDNPKAKFVSGGALLLEVVP